MANFHARTLALLGDEGVRPERSAEVLLAWAMKHTIRLPDSYLEWAKLGGGRVLEKYSIFSSYWFDEPRLIVSSEGMRGIIFGGDRDEDFHEIVTLDQGNDPPVFLAQSGGPRWVRYAKRFSDAVLAQIFDFQLWLSFDMEDPKYKAVKDCGNLYFDSDGCLETLRRLYEESVTTQFESYGDQITEYRFFHSPLLRLNVQVFGDRNTTIRITGSPLEAMNALKLELKALLGRCT